jgi:hypothetical protein
MTQITLNAQSRHLDAFQQAVLRSHGVLTAIIGTG